MPFVRSLALVSALTACESRQPVFQAAQLEEQVRLVLPAVEGATGLKFKQPPVVAARTREQVRTYLLAKLDEELPPDRLEGFVAAYRLFGLIADTVDYRELLLDVYTEQVAGYFDPDSNVLYIVEGVDPVLVRQTIAHELIHALQAQYVDLVDLLAPDKQGSDERMARHTVIEGQATLYAIPVLMPEQDLNRLPALWEEVRYAIRNQQQAMPIFSKAPLVIRESLIFPYLAGADFIRWYDRRYPRTRLAFGEYGPQSTEQILHPDRYADGDAPIRLAFGADPLESRMTFEDEFGEFAIQVLLAELSRQDAVATGAPLAWGGDLFRIYDGEALVWYSVWDYEAARDRFMRRFRPLWASRATRRREYRWTLDPVQVDQRAGLQLVYAPLDWEGWNSLPQVRMQDEPARPL